MFYSFGGCIRFYSILQFRVSAIFFAKYPNDFIIILQPIFNSQSKQYTAGFLLSSCGKSFNLVIFRETFTTFSDFSMYLFYCTPLSILVNILTVIVPN